jgi:predicted metal-dependent phosphoesterase TrpH
MTEGRTVRVDPHVHTEASYDGHSPPEDILDAADRAGLDAVVVTDHDTVAGARAAEALASEYGVAVIRGCEVSTADGHLLAIGVTDRPDPDRPLPATAREVRAQGGVAVVPHPFQRLRHGASADSIAAVDGIEVHNAHTVSNIRNGQAREFAARHGYATYGGSDAHRPRTVGLAATEVTLPPGAPATADSIRRAMREGRTAAVGRRTSAWQYVSKLFTTARIRATALQR